MGYQKKSAFLSLTTMFFWALSMVFVRYLIQKYQVNPVIFTCAITFICSLTLIFVAGPGNNGIETVMAKNSWLFSICQILKNICYITALIYITSTELDLLRNMEIAIALIFTTMFLKRKLNPIDVVGIFLTIIGSFIILNEMHIDIKIIVFFWVFIGAIFGSIRTIVTETHPQNKVQLTIKDRCRVSGYIMMITSILFIAFFGIIAYIGSISPAEVTNQIPFYESLPKAKDFFYIPTVVGSLIHGVFIYSFGMYYYFYAVSVAKNEVFMMYNSFLPVFTYIIEIIFSYFTILTISDISNTDILAGIIVIIGAMAMVLYRVLKEKLLLKSFK